MKQTQASTAWDVLKAGHGTATAAGRLDGTRMWPIPHKGPQNMEKGRSWGQLTGQG